MGVTWAIAIPIGALTGFLVGMMPAPAKLFDDAHTLMHVEYGDDGHKYNNAHESVPGEDGVRANEDKTPAIEMPKIAE